MTATTAPTPHSEEAPVSDFESISCAACGSDAYDVVIVSRRSPGEPVDLEVVFRSSGDEPLKDQAVRCRDCRLVYVRPRLKWELILRGYQDAEDPQFVSQIGFRESTFARCLDRVERSARPNGRRVLDVGTAGGSFLSVARDRGYEPFGCEPSAWMCRFARDHYGLELYQGTLFEAPLAEASYDLVTLWDVLEHTPDPKAVLEKVCRALAPGGVLALTYPDYGSLAARLLGSKWPFLLTVHLYYFERSTMRELLKRCGFEPLAFKPHIQTLEMGYVAERARPYLGPLGSPLVGATRMLGVSRLPFHYWVGQTMVVARKAAVA